MPDTDTIFPLPSLNPEVTRFLEMRRSNLAKVMTEPGPDETVIQQLLTIASRVPDHRKLTPWRFVIFQEKARADFGQHIAAAFMKKNPDMPQDRAIFEGQRFLRAPLVVAVISSPKECPRGTPKWEQELSCGAVCYNLCLAAQAAGFGAQWLTEWYAYDADVQDALGLSPSEKIAGFIYIGTPTEPPKERARPELTPLVTRWSS
ncbi:nitroreductase family protein [Hellea balneolensis]|uniref:nitroreductase family protein n=1 Tax=Hellea balneolensis TaxID=287478 RepID=UPI0004006DBC|nr:nitroreductase [Hellea balneolensis]